MADRSCFGRGAPRAEGPRIKNQPCNGGGRPVSEQYARPWHPGPTLRAVFNPWPIEGSRSLVATLPGVCTCSGTGAAKGCPAPAGSLTAAELDRALLALVWVAQWGVYPRLMTELSTLPANYNYRTLGSLARQDWTSLRQLDPFLDEQGLLRVGGRLQRAGYSFSQTHPLILPRRHLLTARIVASCHTQNKRLGYGHVLAILRERFWVLGGSATVRHYLLGVSAAATLGHHLAPSRWPPCQHPVFKYISQLSPTLRSIISAP